MTNVDYKFLDIVEQIEKEACKQRSTAVKYLFLEYSEDEV